MRPTASGTPTATGRSGSREIVELQSAPRGIDCSRDRTRPGLPTVEIGRPGPTNSVQNSNVSTRSLGTGRSGLTPCALVPLRPTGGKLLSPTSVASWTSTAGNHALAAQVQTSPASRYHADGRFGSRKGLAGRHESPARGYIEELAPVSTPQRRARRRPRPGGLDADPGSMPEVTGPLPQAVTLSNVTVRRGRLPGPEVSGSSQAA